MSKGKLFLGTRGCGSLGPGSLTAKGFGLGSHGISSIGSCGGGAGEVHKYWRIFVHTSVDGLNIEVAELEFRTYINGIDTTSPGGIITASAQALEAAVNAFDGNPASGWRTTGQEQWIKYEYSEPTAVHEISMKAGVVSGTRGPKDFDLQYSDDDVEWVTYLEVLGASGWASQGSVEKIYQIGTQPDYPANSYLYWRLDIATNNGNTSWTKIADMEFRPNAGGNDQTERGVATAKTFEGATYAPWKAFDNTTANSWLTATGEVAPTWIAYQHPVPVVVEEIQISGDSDPTKQVRDFTLQYSSDGIVWFTKASYTGITWIGYEIKTFSAP